MQPSQVPQAPPPIQPVRPGPNPYDFITNHDHQVKKKLLPGGNSTKGRIFIAVAAGLILIFGVVIVVGLISRGSQGPKADYLSLAQQQTELIRISDIGLSQAHQSAAKNLAITTKYSLTSQQPAILALAKKSGAKTDTKTLALGKDTTTDAALTAAEQANQFDAEFIRTLKENLQKYQLTLKKIYDQTSGKSAKNNLSQDYNAVSKLIGS